MFTNNPLELKFSSAELSDMEIMSDNELEMELADMRRCKRLHNDSNNQQQASVTNQLDLQNLKSYPHLPQKQSDMVSNLARSSPMKGQIGCDNGKSAKHQLANGSSHLKQQTGIEQPNLRLYQVLAQIKHTSHHSVQSGGSNDLATGYITGQNINSSLAPNSSLQNKNGQNPSCNPSIVNFSIPLKKRIHFSQNTENNGIQQLSRVTPVTNKFENLKIAGHSSAQTTDYQASLHTDMELGTQRPASDTIQRPISSFGTYMNDSLGGKNHYASFRPIRPHSATPELPRNSSFQNNSGPRTFCTPPSTSNQYPEKSYFSHMNDSYNFSYQPVATNLSTPYFAQNTSDLNFSGKSANFQQNNLHDTSRKHFQQKTNNPEMMKKKRPYRGGDPLKREYFRNKTNSYEKGLSDLAVFQVKQVVAMKKEVKRANEEDKKMKPKKKVKQEKYKKN